jgi:hypothetical protein
LSYHPELGSRRRTWPIAIPFAIVVLLAAAWSGAWYYAVNKAETAVAAWRAREASRGRIYDCASQSTGGYPFRIEVRCTEPTADLRGTRPPLTLKARDLLVAAQVYQPTLLIGEFTGPLSVGEVGKPPSVIVNWSLAQTSLRGTPSAPQRVSVVLDNASLDRIGATQEPIARAGHIELHGRAAGATPQGGPIVDLALRLVAASAANLHPAAAQPFDAEAAAVLRGLKDLAPKPWPERLRELQAAGGEIEIVSARLRQGDTTLVGSGALSLASSGHLNGQLQVTVAGIEALVQKLEIELPPQAGSQAGLNRVAPVLGALDRVSPGLGKFARQQALVGIAVGLGGQQTELEGKPAVSLPVRFQEGEVYFGRLRVGQIAPLF